MEEYSVYILLQDYKNIFGKICKWITKGKYNHASIGIKETMEFYSFRSKWGLCMEHPFHFNKEHKRHVECAIYEIRVSATAYQRIQEAIETFMANQQNYHYSYLSVVLGFLGIRHHFHRGYYCSRFVAEILRTSGAINLHKHHSIYMPSDFPKQISRIHFEGIAKEYASTCIPVRNFGNKLQLHSY